MQGMVWSAVAAVLPVLLLGGCRVAARPAVELELRPEYEAELADHSFAAGRGILKDLAAPLSEHWRPGSRVLLGMETRCGDCREVSFILIELRSDPIPVGADVVIYPADGPPPTPEPSCYYVRATGADTFGVETGRLASKSWLTFSPDSPEGVPGIARVSQEAILLAIHLYDAEGHRRKSAYALAPEAFLRQGLFTICASAVQALGVGEDLSAADAGAIFSVLYGLGETVKGTPNLKQLLGRVMPRPSLWSLVVTGGVVELKALPQLKRVAVEDRPLPALPSGATAYRLPIEVLINDEPGLTCVLTVVEPRPPLDLVGGVIAVDGARSSDPSLAFSVRVLATAVDGSS